MKNQLEIRTVKKKEDRIMFDFFIDGTPLSESLNINRFDLAYSDFDLDTLEVDKAKFPNYDRKEIIKNAVSCFLGNSKPMNQYGTNRIVLYRCHCGSDYCGMVSFTLRIENDIVVWENLNYEDDGDFENDDDLEEELIGSGIKSIKELRFDRREYQLEFENHLVQYCA